MRLPSRGEYSMHGNANSSDGGECSFLPGLTVDPYPLTERISTTQPMYTGLIVNLGPLSKCTPHIPV